MSILHDHLDLMEQTAAAVRDENAMDLRGTSEYGAMLNALRGVLNYADKIDHPDHFENAERERICVECHERNPYRGGAYWPCSYRQHAESIRAVIAEAMQ